MEDLRHCLKISLLALKEKAEGLPWGFINSNLVIPITSVLLLLALSLFIHQYIYYLLFAGNVQGVGETCIWMAGWMDG